jgi:hypothetical protein
MSMSFLRHVMLMVEGLWYSRQRRLGSFALLQKPAGSRASSGCVWSSSERQALRHRNIVSRNREKAPGLRFVLSYWTAEYFTLQMEESDRGVLRNRQRA